MKQPRDYYVLTEESNYDRMKRNRRRRVIVVDITCYIIALSSIIVTIVLLTV